MQYLFLSSHFYIFQSKPIPDSLEPSLTCTKWLAVTCVRDPWWKSAYRLHTFWGNMLLSFQTRFLFVSFTHEFNAFSILIKHHHAQWHNSCCLRPDSKNFFFLLHNCGQKMCSYCRSKQPQHSFFFFLLMKLRTFT